MIEKDLNQQPEPATASADGELSDEQLGQVAGGSTGAADEGKAARYGFIFTGEIE